MRVLQKTVKRADAASATLVAKKEVATASFHAASSAVAQRKRVASRLACKIPAEHLQLYLRSVSTPLGPFSLYVDVDGAVRTCHWQVCPEGDTAALKREMQDICAALQSRWYKEAVVTVVDVHAGASADTTALPGDKAVALLEQYFNPKTAEAGRPEELERVLLQVPVTYPPTATVFMTCTWDVLRHSVPSGQTISYKGLGVRVSHALAESSGAAAGATRMAAPRAIGMAMADNPIPVMVPCHRVLSSTASLRGYGLGLRFKVWLLRHEQADVPAEKLRALETENAISTASSLR